MEEGMVVIDKWNPGHSPTHLAVVKKIATGQMIIRYKTSVEGDDLQILQKDFTRATWTPEIPWVDQQVSHCLIGKVLELFKLPLSSLFLKGKGKYSTMYKQNILNSNVWQLAKNHLIHKAILPDNRDSKKRVLLIMLFPEKVLKIDHPVAIFVLLWLFLTVQCDVCFSRFVRHGLRFGFAEKSADLQCSPNRSDKRCTTNETAADGVSSVFTPLEREMRGINPNVHCDCSLLVVASYGCCSWILP